MVTVELITKRGCHLCEDAATVLDQVCVELDVMWDEKFIEDDPRLASEYFESVPVVLINGRSHATYRVDPTRLRQALEAARTP